MLKFLKVYQIYFKEEQIPKIDYLPFANPDCTPFFESEVIKTLIEKDYHKGSEYFGVVSYQLKDKIGFDMKIKWKSIPNIANHSTTEFTPEAFEMELSRHLPDVMSFQRHFPHDPIAFADKFHPDFSKYFKEIMQKIGYNWVPTHIKNVFYCNFFVAKSKIYEKYAQEMLIPAMKVMQDMPELMHNSYYPKPLPADLQLKFGLKHYPYHAFLCERMFSYYAHLNNLKCLHF